MTQRKQMREQRELLRLERELAKPKKPYYLRLLFVVLCLTYVVDNLSTGLAETVQSNVVTEFYVDKLGVPYNVGLSEFSTVILLFNLINLLAPFYKALSDRFGRKIFLVLNLVGMCFGLVLCGISATLEMHLVGTVVILFFISHDMQITYLVEVAEPKKRATMTGICGFVASISLVITPILRSIFMGNDGTKWRGIFWVPAIMCLVVAVMTSFAAKETDLFLQSRIAYLKTPENERKNSDGDKTGIWQGFKYIFRHRQTTMLLIVACLGILPVAPLLLYYESIMSTSGMSTAQITQALYVYPFFMAFCSLGNGFLSDAIGRKKASVICFGVCAITFSLFIYGLSNGWSPYVIGALYGIYSSAFWSGNDGSTMMMAESSPTALRSSVGAARALSFSVFYMISYIISIFTIGASENLGMTCLTTGLPFVVITVIVTLAATKETKDVDLNNVQIT